MGGSEAPTFLVRAEALTPEQQQAEAERVRRARLTVCHYARHADGVPREVAAELLDMLGIGPEPNELAAVGNLAWMRIIDARGQAVKMKPHLVDVAEPRRSLCGCVEREPGQWTPDLGGEDERCQQCARR